MTTPTPGRVWITPPPVEPYTYGLLNVAEVNEGAGQWQIGGVQYNTDHCATGGYVVGSCPVPAGGTQTAELTVTPDPGSGEGYEVRATSATAPNTLEFTAGTNLPGPLTIHAELLQDPQAVATSELCNATDLMVNLANGNTSPSALVSVPPGSARFLTLADGTWRITAPGCTPHEITLPLPDPDPGVVLAACTTVAFNVTATSAGASEFPVNFTLGPLGGTLAPGETTAQYLFSGTYALDATVPGGGVRAVVTVPGDPVTVELEYSPTTHDKHCSYGVEHVLSPPPFTAYACYECAAVGSDDPQPAALARLRCVEGRQVEEFFSAHVLAQADRFPAGQDPLGLNLALGVLEEDAARHYCGQPTLHAPRWTQPFFSHHRLVRELGPHLRTWLRSRIAFGGGYLTDPYNPEATSHDEFWLFATGTVRAHRAPPFVNETFRPRDNKRLAIAERTYLLDHDCYVAAVKVAVPTQGGQA